jgi:hypothetical protein
VVYQEACDFMKLGQMLCWILGVRRHIRIKEIYFSITFFNLFVRKGRKKGKVLTYRSHVMD